MAVIALAGLLTLPHFLGFHHQDLLIFLTINVLAVCSYRLVTLTGEWSLIHAVMMGVGAYTVALSANHFDLAIWFTLPLAGGVAGLVAALLCFPLLRMTQFYFLIGSFAAGEAIRLTWVEFVGVFGGTSGLRGVEAPIVWGIDFIDPIPYFYFCLGVVSFCLLILYRIEHSRIGLTLNAIHWKAALAESVGVDAWRYRALAFILGSFFVGIAGGLKVHYLGSVTPEPVHHRLYGVHPDLGNRGGLQQVLRSHYRRRGADYFRRVHPQCRSHSPGDLWRHADSFDPVFAAGPGKHTGKDQGPVWQKNRSTTQTFARLKPLMPILEINHVTKQFGGLLALDDVSFQVEEGEIRGLIGPNGAGKSTMFKNIAGFHVPTKGSIVYQGQHIEGKKPHTIAEMGIVRTFQETTLFQELSVFDNALVGAHIKSRTNVFAAVLGLDRQKQQAASDKVIEVLEFMGLIDRRDQLASELPLGSQRALALAIALVSEPKMMLMDEPFAGMNPEETNHMMDLTRKVRESGITIVLVEHDMKAVMGLCSYLTVLNFGQLLAEGTPDDVRNNDRVIEAYLGGTK